MKTSIVFLSVGFGKTPAKLDGVADYYMSKVEYLSRLVEKLKLKQMIMVSPSMSGNYGLPYVLSYPELIAGFVPIAPAATGIVPPSKVRALQVCTIHETQKVVHRTVMPFFMS